MAVLISVCWIVSTFFSFSQENADSIVLYSDLRFHSLFEEEAMHNFVINKQDTFNLFMAIDKNTGKEEAVRYYDEFLKVFEELRKKKIETKNISRKIVLAYSVVHDRFLKKYDDRDYYPVMFQTGSYNCVSASMLYAQVFERLKIPYKIMVSSNHVYLVANPGTKSVVIETTNPDFEKAIFTGEFKQQYVNSLRDSKLISETDYKNKSVEEIFEEKFNETREAEFNNLPGFQYYNKTLAMARNEEVSEAYELCQKAYFFYPDPQIRTLLQNLLLLRIEKCNFSQVSDIDYIIQLFRFPNIQKDIISGIFNNIIFHHLQYVNKEGFCDSLYKRLLGGIPDEEVREEISFNYYLQLASRFQHSERFENYIENALKIKGNHQETINIMSAILQEKLSNIRDPNVLIDTLEYYRKRYDYEYVKSIFDEFESIAYLRIAGDSYRKYNVSAGEKYLNLFEEKCKTPVRNVFLINTIETTYRAVVYYHSNRGNKTKARNIADRGLKFVPGSELIRSALE